MGLLDALAAAFIRTFGITDPPEALRRRAAWFIVGLVVLTLVVVAAIGYVLHLALTS